MSYSEENNPKTLYVGNLDASVSEELLCALFSQMGPVKGCKIIREPGNDPYAFVEFTNHQSAATALAAMNKRMFLEKEMKVNWATSPGNQTKQDTSSHHHIFVGDLSPEIDVEALREAFSPFGEISNCRIVRDPQTLKSKGYAFVSFVKRAEAESAIAAMNGQWLGSRSIRTNWSTRKPPPPRAERAKQASTKIASYEEVYNQTSPTNTTVYCGGFTNIGDDVLDKTFSRFGQIQDIRSFKDKGYAFIRFGTKEAAARAIEVMHNGEINGQNVKCFWGKENIDTSQSGQGNQSGGQAAGGGVAGSPQSYQYTPYAEVGYWYPPNTYPQNPNAAAQMQGQYMGGMPQQYAAAYGQFQYPPGYRVVPGWQGIPAGQAAPPGSTVPPMMAAYSMPQFQAQ